MLRRTFLRAGGLLPAAVFCFQKSVFSTSFKRIALTFDDGPEPAVLVRLLPLLEKHGVPATFFVIGELAVNRGTILAHAHILGHEFENHGYQHVKFTKLLASEGIEGVRKSLQKTAAIIWKETGRTPRFFRPPFWDSNSELEQVINSFGYRMMKIGNPDINSLDYDDVANKRSPSVLVERMKGQAESRNKNAIVDCIFVVHERALTVLALEHFIPHMQDRGFVFCRLDAIL